jgi:dUTP pyrophosphatase
MHPDAKVPRYAHSGANGDLAADLYSVQELELPPGKVVPISTGIALAIPDGFGAIVQDRSGVALQGLATLAGVIDTGYRGEIKVVMVNLGETAATIRKGDRIAQLRIVHRIEATFTEESELPSTQRQANGFGSTGS